VNSLCEKFGAGGIGPTEFSPWPGEEALLPGIYII